VSSDWLRVCRAATEDVRGVLAALPLRAAREAVLGAGVGGDDTTAIDQAAENAILAHFTDLDVTLVSEEAGSMCPICGWDLHDAYQGPPTAIGEADRRESAGARSGGWDGAA